MSERKHKVKSGDKNIIKIDDFYKNIILRIIQEFNVNKQIIPTKFK